MQYTDVKNEIENLLYTNKEDTLKALIALEFNIDNKELLNAMYNRYQENADLALFGTRDPYFSHYMGDLSSSKSLNKYVV